MSSPSDSFAGAIKRRTYLEAVTGFSRSTIYGPSGISVGEPGQDRGIWQ